MSTWLWCRAWPSSVRFHPRSANRVPVLNRGQRYLRLRNINGTPPTTPFQVETKNKFQINCKQYIPQFVKYRFSVVRLYLSKTQSAYVGYFIVNKLFKTHNQLISNTGYCSGTGESTVVWSTTSIVRAILRWFIVRDTVSRTINHPDTVSFGIPDTRKSEC